MAEIDRALEASKPQAVELADVRRHMANISEVYGCLQPFEQRELMQLIIQRAEINEREMVLEIRTGACVWATEPTRRDSGAKGKLRFEPPDWLPILDKR